MPRQALLLMRMPAGRIALVGAVLMVVGLLAACGNNTGAGVTPTPVTAADVCPAGQHAMSLPANAVVANEQTPAHAATVSRGQTLVIELPPQMRWSYDPAASHAANLTVRQPTGTLDSAVGVCFWQWRAQSVGTAKLVFHGQPNCTASQQVCPPTGAGATPPSGSTSTTTGAGANAGSGSGSSGSGAVPAGTVPPGYTTSITFTVDVH